MTQLTIINRMFAACTAAHVYARSCMHASLHFNTICARRLVIFRVRAHAFEGS